MLGLVPLVKALSWTILTIDSTVVTICTACVFMAVTINSYKCCVIEQYYRFVLVTQAKCSL
jgi:hypothetical protein